MEWYLHELIIYGTEDYGMDQCVKGMVERKERW